MALTSGSTLAWFPGSESIRTIFAPTAWIWSSSKVWSAGLRSMIVYPGEIPNRGMLPIIVDGGGEELGGGEEAGGAEEFAIVTEPDALADRPSFA
jgi:hypothetical protein